MDLNQAILYAQLVNAAYAVPPNDLGNHAGQTVTPSWGGGTVTFDVITSLFACDLATEANPNRGKSQVSIGLVLQAQGSGQAAIVFRGTEGIKEWVLDAHFGTVPCPFLDSAGETEDGFTDMYESVTIDAAAGSPKLIEALTTLKWKQGVPNVTVCGHSLGGALATLATLDITVNAPAPYHNTISYTYASPKTGNTQFVAKYNQLAGETFRVFNQLDVVPRLPLLGYQHVMGDLELKSFTILPPPPQFLLQPNPFCEHILTDYLHLLSLLAGGPALPFHALCGPVANFSDLMKVVETDWNDMENLKKKFAATAGQGLQ